MAGVRIGRYEVTSELGRGGMGIVYKAVDPILERDLAIKILPPKKLSDDLIKRFLREAKAQAHLDSPHIIKIFDIGEQADGDNKIYYIVMEFVQGRTLGERFSDGAPTSFEDLWQRLELFDQVLEAMEYAHGRGVIHRDLKPDNVMISLDDRVKIMDFGLAFFAGSNSLTRADQIMGTVAYFSPEQAKAAKDVDHRADIYSLGVILFELMTGELPFKAEHPLDMMQKLLTEAPRRPSALNSIVTSELEAICLKCLEKLPAVRYAKVSDLRQALQGVKAPEKDAGAKTAQLGPRLEQKPDTMPGLSIASTPKKHEPIALDTRSFSLLPKEPLDSPSPKASAVSSFATVLENVLGIEDDSSLAQPASVPIVHSLHPSLASSSWQHSMLEEQKDAKPVQPAAASESKPSFSSLGPSIFCQCGGENPPGTDICLECGEAIRPSIYIVRREAETHYSSGMQALEKGHLNEARRELKLAVEQNCEFGEAYLELGRVEISLGFFEAAHDSLELALQHMNSRIQPLLALADLYQQVEQPEDVVACLRDVLSERPRDTEIRCRLALLYCQLDDVPKALSTYRTALKHDPQNLAANRQLGLLLAANNQEDEAIFYLETVCRLDANDGYVRGILGKLYAAAGRLRQAEDTFHQALSLRRDDPDLRVELGELYSRQGLMDKALAQLNKTLRREEGHLGASKRLAKLYSEQGELDEALVLLKKAARFHPEDDDLQRQMGEIFLGQGNLDGALGCFEQVVELRPDCADMRSKLGRIYLKKNYDEKAVEEYQAAIKSDPLQPSYREDLGMAYYVGGQLDRAASELHKAAKLDGRNADYFRALGFIYQELNMPGPAIEHFRWALHLEPSDAKTLGALGQALVQHGLANQAVEQFKEALRIDPSLNLLHLSLARALTLAGHLKEAIASFRAFAASIDEKQGSQLLSRAFLDMGRTLLLSRELGAAAEVFQAALAQPGVEAQARVGLAQVSLGRSDLKNANAHLKRAMQLEPLNAEVWHAWSLAAAEEKQWDEAVRRLERAISLNPSDEELWVELGRSYRKAGKLPEADDAFRRGGEKFPHARARFAWLRGRLAARQKDWTKAYDQLCYSLQLAPGSWRVHEDMARACISLNNFGQAREHIQKALEYAPASEREDLLKMLKEVP